MAVVVESSTDQVAAAQNNNVFPVPAEVKADNEAQAAKKVANDSGKTDKSSVSAPKPAAEPKAEADSAKAVVKDDDDVEGEDGLTPRQKRDFTESMRKTIAKKHRLQKEAEEFATREFNQRTLADQRAENLAKELAALKEQSKPAPVEDKLPSREAYKSDQEYWDAMVDYRVDQKLKVAQAEAQRQAEESRQQQLIQSAAAKIERAIELVPDFKEVTEAMDATVPPYVASYMQESDLFAELGYHFATNPDVLAKLSSITEGIRQGTREYTNAVTKQLVALGKIESTLQPFASKKANGAEDAKDDLKPSTSEPVSRETGTAPSKPRVTAPIIRPLDSGSAAQVERDEADMTGSQSLAAWQKRHGVNLTARKRH